jgi:hypothetical protein
VTILAKAKNGASQDTEKKEKLRRAEWGIFGA